MSYSGWINENLFLDWLKHFLKFKYEGKVLLILDNHGSYASYEAIRFCKDHGIELIGLPPHSTHVLQPLDRTFFKSLKAQYHKNATEWMHRNPAEAINKVRFSSLFAEAYNKVATVGAAVKGSMCSGIMPLQKYVILDERYAPSILFQLHGTEQDGNATEKNTSSHRAPMNRELAPKASVEPHCSKRTQGVIVCEIMPTPEKKKNTEFEALDFG
jgi:hypothetical protein